MEQLRNNNRFTAIGKINDIEKLKNGEDIFTNFELTNDEIRIHCVIKNLDNDIKLKNGDNVNIEGKLALKYKKDKYWYQINIDDIKVNIK